MHLSLYLIDILFDIRVTYYKSNLYFVTFLAWLNREITKWWFFTEANKGVENPAGATISFKGFKLLFV